MHVELVPNLLAGGSMCADSIQTLFYSIGGG